MDPNNPNLQKLQDDLKNMSSTPAVSSSETPPAPPEVSVPTQAPAPVTPEVPTPVSGPEPIEPPAEKPKSGSPIVTTAIVLGIVAILAAGAYVLGAMYLGKPAAPKACTTEAKICPDGSSVGRIGPSCEFAACPTFIPVATGTPSVTATGSATPTGTPKATSTPVSSPTASPITH